MPADTQQILEAAENLGRLVAQHPAIDRYRQAQHALADDPDAARLLNDFNRHLMNLARQEESGVPVTDAQRHQLEGLQGQLAAHLKVKALSVAQVEYIDLMRRISDLIRKFVAETPAAAAAAPGSPATSRPAAKPAEPPAGPRLVI